MNQLRLSQSSFLAQSFKIPLLFGGISIDRTPKNEIQVGVQRGVNILGNGYDRNTKLAIGDGTFGASGEFWHAN